MVRLFRRLPGPVPVQAFLAVVIIVALLIALHFFYEWLGDLLFDSGGAVG